MDAKGWLDLLVLAGLIVLAVERWIRRRESSEMTIGGNMGRVIERVEELEGDVRIVRKQGHDNANAIGRVQAELAIRAEQLKENTQRIDDVYRAMKRNGSGQ